MICLKRHCFLLGASTLLLLGCEQGEGELTGIYVAMETCTDTGGPHRIEPFRMELNFLSVIEAKQTATIRLSPTGKSIDAADQLVLTVPNVALVHEAIEAHGVAQIPLAIEEEGSGVAALGLFGTCKRPGDALQAIGTLELFAYGARSGDRVEGRIHFDLYDRRDQRLAGEGFSGTFSFEVQTGQPWTAFAPHDLR